jgi:hypothetical protein
MTSKFIPNAYQTPNAYVDDLMAYLTPEEWKVLSYAVRRILGFNKRQDRISKSQFMDGTKDDEGNPLDHGTGLGEAAVKNALESLTHFRILIKVAENDPAQNKGRAYALQMESDQVDMDGLIQRMEEQKNHQNGRMKKAREAQKQVKEGVPNGLGVGLLDSPTLPVSNNDTPPVSDNVNNNQDKQDIQGARKRTAPAPNSRKKADPRSKHPAILCVHGVTGYMPPKEAYDKVIEVLGESPDGEKLSRTFATWVTRGNKRTNIDGVLDWFKGGIPEPPQRNGSKGYGAPQNASALGYSRAGR